MIIRVPEPDPSHGRGGLKGRREFRFQAEETIHDRLSPRDDRIGKGRVHSRGLDGISDFLVGELCDPFPIFLRIGLDRVGEDGIEDRGGVAPRAQKGIHFGDLGRERFRPPSRSEREGSSLVDAIPLSSLLCKIIEFHSDHIPIRVQRSAQVMFRDLVLIVLGPLLPAKAGDRDHVVHPLRDEGEAVLSVPLQRLQARLGRAQAEL